MDWRSTLGQVVVVALIIGTVGWLRARSSRARPAAGTAPGAERKLTWHGFQGLEAFAKWVEEAPDAGERARRELLRREAYQVGSDVWERRLRVSEGPAELRRRVPGFDEPLYAAAFEAGRFESMW